METQHVAPSNGRKALTLEDVSRDYQLGRTKLFEEIASGRLKTYKVGRRRFTTPEFAAEWQQDLVKAAA